MTTSDDVARRDSVDEPDLVALTGSRLCHDLASPLGAIGNGLELLELSGGTGTEELALIRGSLDAALARLRFFRLAFGAGDGTQMIPARDVIDIVRAMYRDTRTKVHWRDQDERPRAEMRLALLGLNCIEVAIPWGAVVEVTRNDACWVLHVTAERLRVDEPLWQSLGRGDVPPDLAGSEVQFGLLQRQSRRQKRPVTVTADERHLSLVI
ncbi:histidine phosphotransferase family protein [Jannaschia sp. LMIT008]|uniref:histidine phosphotransferase family protein n=1 Tax=Jannaschia maritima TaxID=3032585 RepID=UPI00281151E1|nr:histidine phosphotransferase family protein [Jannaschia sp. LMIT008]